MEAIQTFFSNINIDLKLIINILIAILIFNLFFLLKGKLAYLIIKLFRLKTKDKKYITSNPFFKPLKIFFPILGLYIAAIFLNLPQNVLAIVFKLFKCSVILLIAIGIANSITPKFNFFSRLNTGKENSMTSLIIKIIRFVIYIFAFVIIISELGYNINGLIAGLGLGGLTVALAAQDTAKNLFGGLVILTDKPFKVGDWIQISTIEGTVEDITFRSTRLRTASDTIITIPNSKLVDDQIINWSKLNKRRIEINITIDFKTTLKSMCDLTSKMQAILQSSENVLQDSVSVHFDEIESNGYKLFIYFYSSLTTYKDYLDVKENANYKIMQIIQNSKINIAYPSNSIYIQK